MQRLSGRSAAPAATRRWAGVISSDIVAGLPREGSVGIAYIPGAPMKHPALGNLLYQTTRAAFLAQEKNSLLGIGGTSSTPWP